MDVLEEDDVSMHEAKKIMLQREKERELIYDQKICLDYLKRTANLTEAQIKQISDELALIPILKTRHIKMILNILPETEEEVDLLFSKETTTLKKEEMQKIVEIVKKYA
ncbi:hypothetical protein HZB03_05335 [Candidatus Woesearchaeota archaeon]|nr:hypothetical protein [Candidatus Woesearchaeota archaeon]